jgi:ribosomal protein S18 acetylase RimI-like enzyme
MSEPEVRVVAAEGAAPEEELEAIRRELRAYNRATSPAFYELRDRPENAPRLLHVVAYDAGGAVVGGLLGETCLAWFDIEILAVRGEDRRRGLGRRIMRAAEKEAAARGCRWASVDTMDWQAPGFYERLGYAVVGRFEDRDGRGHTKLFLTRRIA